MKTIIKDRPEYVTCVRTGVPDDTMTWCGKNSTAEFAFLSPTHAILNAKQQGRLLICEECSAAIKEVLEEGTFTGIRISS